MSYSRGQECLIAHARKKNGHEIPLRALDGSNPELGMPHDVGDLESAGNGLRVYAAAKRAQAAVARTTINHVEIFAEIV
jgi:hypothetical protein